jgi:hypothetical protein
LFKLLLPQYDDKIIVILALIVSIIYEGKDYYHTYVTGQVNCSALNSIADIVANLIGILGGLLFVKPSLSSLIFFTILSIFCLVLKP